MLVVHTAVLTPYVGGAFMLGVHTAVPRTYVFPRTSTYEDEQKKEDDTK